MVNKKSLERSLGINPITNVFNAGLIMGFEKIQLLTVRHDRDTAEEKTC